MMIKLRFPVFSLVALLLASLPACVDAVSDAGTSDAGDDDVDAGDDDVDAGDDDVDAGDSGNEDPLCEEFATPENQEEHQVIHFVGDDGIVVWLTRDYVGQGVGNSSIFSTPRISVKQGDIDTCITDAAALSYDSTHHNFEDSAEAIVDDETRFLIRVAIGLTPPYPFITTLSRLDGAGEVIAGPFVIEDEDGFFWP